MGPVERVRYVSNHLQRRLTPLAPATPNSKDIKKSFVSRSTLVDSLADAEKSRVLKVKADTIKRLPKPTKPGNWDSEFKDGPTDSPSKDVKISHVPADVAKAFSAGRPLDDKAEIIKCNHCKRAILKHRARAHVEDCIAKKQEKQRKKKEAKDARDAAARRERDGGSESADDDGASISGSKTARKSDAVDGEAGKSKKRRAEDIDAGPKKKKKKDEPKAKAPRPKAPVDVEKQCGVELPQGGQCARSLTCKSHSMGAKRAVPGRSAPYDKLLAEYQRKNQAKLQSMYRHEARPSTNTLLIILHRSSNGISASATGRRACDLWAYRLGRGEGPCARGYSSLSSCAYIPAANGAFAEEVRARPPQGDAWQRAGRWRYRESIRSCGWMRRPLYEFLFRSLYTQSMHCS